MFAVEALSFFTAAVKIAHAFACAQHSKLVEGVYHLCLPA